VDNADPKLERSTESVRDPLRRASADGRHRRELTYTESNLGPVRAVAFVGYYELRHYKQIQEIIRRLD
jgi:hypothetical protein